MQPVLDCVAYSSCWCNVCSLYWIVLPVLAVGVTYAACTGLCCLFSGCRLRISVLLFYFSLCVENRGFFFFQKCVCLWSVGLFVLHALASAVFHVNVISRLATEINMQTDGQASISERVMPTSTSDFSQYIIGMNQYNQFLILNFRLVLNIVNFL